ncbi:MAG TPA: molybdopterin-dependent oxidoreductase [Myxococcales bacterium]|jgi:formate dehydrogenase major subunit|nr:molybdopterin-dependent oxidoreductase [Myxococcales bacterium]
MTNHWADLEHSKVFLIEGSNTAENHVMAMKWIRKAQEKGAKIIHVDPRYNRTSDIADVYARIRPGADIAFLGAVIRLVIENGWYDAEYVKLHTNALYLARDDFGIADGLFTGYDREKHKYDMASWGYQLGKDKKPKKASSLEDPQCVFQKLRTHFSRYTPQVAEEISGIPAKQIEEIAELFAKNRPGTILYALGMTQHTVGVQNIRCYCILQLLLGNIGKIGGGVNALRGEPNVQGACDMSVLANYMFGYNDSPALSQPTLADWTKDNGTFNRKMVLNGLKAWFGENGTAENDFGYGWLPKRSGKKDYATMGIVDASYAGEMKLLWVLGQNPMVTNPNLNYVREALSKIDFMVVQELWETETAAFWQAPGTDAKKIQTEVILLPAAYFMEKEGCLSNSGGLLQWRYAGVKPPGQARPDLDVIDEVFRRVRDLYKGSTDAKDAAILKANWNYPREGLAEAVLQEINGRAWKDVPAKNLKQGDLVAGIGELQADGSTSSGAWIYAGCFARGKNLTKRRNFRAERLKQTGLTLNSTYAWTWPGNMKILYNRASCDADGQPMPARDAKGNILAAAVPMIQWDKTQKKWVGIDVPDVPDPTKGPDTPEGHQPFRMGAEGVGKLMANTYEDPDAKEPGMPRDVAYVPKDGPLPEFYEPVESPVSNLLHPGAQNNPCLKYPRVPGKQPIGTAKDFPYVLMTSSMAEHWCAGSTTRNIPWLNELAPEPMIEMPVELGAKLGIKTGDWTRVSSARGEMVVKAVVTRRMQTLRIAGQEVTIVWMPYNWGFKGLSRGPSTNVLTIDAGDPGAGTQETKACLVNVVPAKDAAGELAVSSLAPRSGGRR